MAAYAYKLPRKYRYRRRGNSNTGPVAGVALVAALVAASGTAKIAHAAAPAGGGTAAAQAIGYAKDQLGCPYTWGGTGPCAAGFDCSGLTQAAWSAAGVSIPRTSEEQWASLPHISRSQLQPGDLVFAAGADGTLASPGHVVMYIGHGKIIQAYGQGVPLEVSSLASVNAAGLVGYARP